MIMIVDTYPQKYSVKRYIANFHFVGAVGDVEIKICTILLNVLFF